MVKRSRHIEYIKKFGGTSPKIDEYDRKIRRQARQYSLNSSSPRVNASNRLLKKCGNGWKFDSEQSLEEFIFKHIEQLFDLKSLKRQYYLEGERIDILGLDRNKRLAILELKNTEERHIVQQLTRYYAGVCEDTLLQKQLDFKYPIRLIAIAPSFHNSNFIDRKYSQLPFEFWQFNIVQDTNKLYFKISNLDIGETRQVPLEFSAKNTELPVDYIPELPRALTNILSQADSQTQNKLIEIRHRILSFHERIHEITATGVIRYGRGKTNLCAEIRVNRRCQQKHIDLWLYLPIPRRQNRVKGRMQVVTNDWKTVKWLVYTPVTRRTGSMYQLQDFPQLKRQTPSEAIDALVDLALETWLVKNS